jgi:uncharacterized membrane protein
MAMQFSDRTMERVVSVILRSGVLLSGTVVFLGGALYLAWHAGDRVDYRIFHAQPPSDRLVHGILAGALTGRGLSIIQLGVLLLLATPIVRVAFSIIGFAIERDKLYVLITSLVLAILLFSLIDGGVRGG